MMIFRTQSTAAAILVGMIGVASNAANAATDAPRTDGQKQMQRADKNGDHKISREEAAAYPRLAQRFDAIDANNDGFITRDEMKAVHAKVASARLKAIDTDGDGRISRAEANAKAPRLAKNFDAMDTNKDGYLSKDEMAAAKKRRLDSR